MNHVRRCDADAGSVLGSVAVALSDANEAAMPRCFSNESMGSLLARRRWSHTNLTFLSRQRRLGAEVGIDHVSSRAWNLNCSSTGHRILAITRLCCGL